MSSGKVSDQASYVVGVDVGGTFTDLVACDPDGRLQVRKVLSLQPGVPGDPANGVKVMTTNALGNCVACHQIAALPKVAKGKRAKKH